jgi:hypothetical protein
VPALPCAGGADLLRRLFEPLGYTVTLTEHALDATFTDWGPSSIFGLQIDGTVTLSDLLSHLYVLIPVLDNEKHYWVGDDEVAKLLRHGEGWLARHPERELIATRYLKYRRSLADEAIRQLREQDGEGPTEIDADAPDDPREEAGEKKLSLHQQRHGVVLSVLRARGARRVADLGCGEGRLLRELLQDSAFERVLGVDVSHRTLEAAAERLRLDRLPPTVRQRRTMEPLCEDWRNGEVSLASPVTDCILNGYQVVPRLDTRQSPRGAWRAGGPGDDERSDSISNVDAGGGLHQPCGPGERRGGADARLLAGAQRPRRARQRRRLPFSRRACGGRRVPAARGPLQGLHVVAGGRADGDARYHRAHVQQVPPLAHRRRRDGGRLFRGRARLAA